MRCPQCGIAVSPSASRCPACNRTLGSGATGGLTSAPDAPTVFLPPGGAGQGPEERAESSDDDGTRLGGLESAPTQLGIGAATGSSDEDSLTRLVDDDAAATMLATPPGTRAPAARGASSGLGTSEAGPLKLGEAFGTRYHIIRLLGIGGMGAVYQAWDEELGVVVAIKVIRPEAMADPGAAAEIERRFKRELLLARQVTHKNVVRIHDLGEVGGIKYITMPFVDGDDLATIAKAGRLPIAKVLRIARAVTSGLVAAHAAGVVHRDLKPANIMVDADDEAMIMDFGIARSTGGASRDATLWQGMPSQIKRSMPAFADATMFGAVVGTVAYMAPEQAKGQSADQRVDIYAFGLILYDLLVGRRRADHAVSSIAELQGRMEKAPPPPRSIEPDIPEAVDRIVTRCIEPDPAKRYQTTVELEAELNRLDDNGELIPIPARFSKRLIAGAATLLLSLMAGTWWLTRTPPPPKQHDPVSVVIADFENKTNDPTFEHTLESVLKLALEGAGFISAYDRTQMPALGLPPVAGKLEETAARQIALGQGFGVVITGSVERQGDAYKLSFKALQAVTGDTITTAEGRASNKEQVLTATTKLATSVRKALGDDTSESAQRFAMETLNARSLDVVHEYARAMEALSNGKYEDARLSAAKAAELDPQFGGAYGVQAAALRGLGQQREAEEAIKLAVANLSHLTERERYRTRGLSFLLSGDHQKCKDEYEALIGRFASDASARNNLALCAAQLRKLPQAVEEMRRSVAILPKSVQKRSNLTEFVVYSGDFQGAEREAAETLKLDPAARKVFTPLALAQLGQDRLADAAETYRKLSDISATDGAAGLADLAVYEGRFSDAAGILEKAAAADVAAKRVDKGADKYAALAYTELARGQKTRAVKAAENALANSTAVKVRFLAARIFIATGNATRARPIATSLGADLRNEPQAYAKLIEGEAALQEKKVREAVAAFTEANKLLDTWIGHFDLGRAYLEAGALLEADGEFDRCIKRRGEAMALFLDQVPTYGYFPPVYYYVGRVREGLKTSGFAEFYQKYLSIRAKAGEDPLLADVRRRAGS
jgi:serine/threonine protein kinase/tetratricopeptide (TPR) repeat protein